MTSSDDQQPAPGTATVISAALKARRNQAGLSLDAMARRVGLSTSTLSRYERGQCLPSNKHLDTICKALVISNPERLQLLQELEQARANSSAARPQESPSRQHRRAAVGGTVAGAIRRHWPPTVRLTTVAVALLGLAVTAGYLILGRQADPSLDQTLYPSCDRFTVGSRDLYLRDFYGDPTRGQLPHGEVLTVTQRSHPRGLHYWNVTTKTDQEGWVDPQ